MCAARAISGSRTTSETASSVSGTAEAERRQAAQDIRSSEDVVIELLRNARDAGASRIFLATQKTGNARLLTVLDDGQGIPAAHARAHL